MYLTIAHALLLLSASPPVFAILCSIPTTTPTRNLMRIVHACVVALALLLLVAGCRQGEVAFVQRHLASGKIDIAARGVGFLGAIE